MLWKKILPVSLLLCSVWATSLQANVGSDVLLGFWLTEEEDATIQIYKSESGKYEGKIVWLKDLHTGKKKQIFDDQNEDKSRHTRPVLGMVNLKNFSFDKKENEWSGGTIYDPVKGKTYSAYMKLKKGKMHLRGYIGISLFGRTSVWTREDQALPKKYR